MNNNEKLPHHTKCLKKVAFRLRKFGGLPLDRLILMERLFLIRSYVFICRESIDRKFRNACRTRKVFCLIICHNMKVYIQLLLKRGVDSQARSICPPRLTKNSCWRSRREDPLSTPKPVLVSVLVLALLVSFGVRLLDVGLSFSFRCSVYGFFSVSGLSTLRD